MPVPQPEEVLDLARELKEARSRVAELESRWESLFHQPGPPGPSQNGIATLQFLKPRIVAFLEQHPDRSFTMSDVAASLKAKENSVGPYLSDLVKEGKIERRERGFYGALKAVDEDPFR